MMMTTVGDMPKREIDEGTRQRVVEMYQAGENVERITEAAGIGRGSLYSILRERGIAPDRQRTATTLLVPALGFDDEGRINAERVMQRIAELERQVGQLTEQRRLLLGMLDLAKAKLPDDARRQFEQLVSLLGEDPSP